MPNSSNDLPTGHPVEVEDIFSEADPGAAVPVSLASVPLEATSEVDDMVDATTVPSGRTPVRRWLLIAILGGGLLVLLGIGLVIWFWLRGQTAAVRDDDIINVPVDTNTPPINSEVNTNQTNTDTTPVTDLPFTDVDHDGLSDQEELVANTNPKKRDTDEDGLSDREEVRVYLTDPRNPDTDSDGYADGKEVENFYHPNDPDPKKRLFDLPN